MRPLTACGVLLGLTAGLALFPACQSTPPAPTQINNPGALPTANTDVVPRLNASTYLAHGHLLERQGNLEGALIQYRQALAQTPDLVAAHNRMGITLDKLGRHAEAAAAFREALQREPNASHLHNNLGFSLYLAGQYDAAEQALARAIELEPQFRRAHMNLGMVLARLQRDEAALTEFSLAGTEPDAYYNLAIIQAETGRYAAAARSLEHALALNPNFTEARQQLREIARMAAAAELAQAAAVEAAAAQVAAPAEPEPGPMSMPLDEETPFALALDQQILPAAAPDTQAQIEALLASAGTRIGRLTSSDAECLGELIRALLSASTATPPWPAETLNRVETLLAQLEGE